MSEKKKTKFTSSPIQSDLKSASSAFICVQKIFLTVFAVFVLLSISGCTFLFFKPAKELVIDPEILAYVPEEIAFKSPDDVDLSGWYFRARGEERGTILVCHGNVENMGSHVKLDLWLIDAGYNLFIFDYRGYGRSGGMPTVKGINRDAEAALETVLKRLPMGKNDRVIVFGKSLGAAVAVYTVANSPYRDRVKALILDSAFASYRRIAQDRVSGSVIGWPFQYPLSWIVNNEYSPVDFIGRISPIPVVIVHSRQDEIVPFGHGRMLYDAAQEPKEFWEVRTPGHVRLQADVEARKRLLGYFESLR